MAVLWVRLKGGEVPWGVAVLDAQEAVELVGDRARPLRVATADGRRVEGAVVLRHDAGGAGGVGWVLIRGRGREVRVNGMVERLGVRALRHQDQIEVGDQRMYFSTESLASVGPFPGAGRPVFCPRCKQEIEAGVPAVQCPSCGLWHHETPELNCWTYAPHCSTCSQGTEVGGEYRWVPED